MNACISAEDVSNTRYQRVSNTGRVLYTRISRWIIPLELWENQHKKVFCDHINWVAFLWWWDHIASAAPNPTAAQPDFPKTFGRSPDESDNYRKCPDCHNYSEDERMYIDWFWWGRCTCPWHGRKYSVLFWHLKCVLWTFYMWCTHLQLQHLQQMQNLAKLAAGALHMAASSDMFVSVMRQSGLWGYYADSVERHFRPWFAQLFLENVSYFAMHPTSTVAYAHVGDGQYHDALQHFCESRKSSDWHSFSQHRQSLGWQLGHLKRICFHKMLHLYTSTLWNRSF